MDTRSIIVAIASPPGSSARGLVRISGEGCRALVARLSGTPALPRGIHASRLAAPAPECPCLLAIMPGPGSSTGEDCVEIHVPGNPALLERIAAAVVSCSEGAARRAGPGEFSARAVLNGRLTVAEAERAAAAVAAATDAQLAAADAMKGDAAGRAAHAAADEVATLLALVEAGIDFTDQEDVSAIAPERLAQRALAAADQLEGIAIASAGREAALAAPLVLLAGPPNAGKSSLFNALLGQARAVASPQAGTTRDVLREPLALADDLTVVLADAPGLDRAAGALDALLQAQAEAALASADVVLWCTPTRATATSPPALRAAVVHVRTMCDQSGDGPVANAVATSAVTGEGIAGLRAAIGAALAERPALGAGERMALGAVQRELLAHAIAALRDAAATAQAAPPGARALPHAELAAASLRLALDRLGEIAGAVPPDDVLGRLFARFCVGK